MTIECHHQNLIQMSRADEREDIERKEEDIESTERIGKVKDVRKRNGRPKVFTQVSFILVVRVLYNIQHTPRTCKRSDEI